VDDPHAPLTPYREGKQLTEIIPPDHRRLKAFALVLGSMIAGVILWVLGGRAVDALRAPSAGAAPTTSAYQAGRIIPSVLHGPERDVAMPPATLSIVHVWLQGCQDCMPAFEAMRRLQDEGGLGVDVPIYNVAYGEADPTWARRYGVDSNLVYDAGGASVVRPLGIETFTTLVVDKGGTILLRDRPDRPGFRARLRAALHAEDPRGNTSPYEPGDPFAPNGGAELDAALIRRVVAAHRLGIRRTCWDQRADHAASGNVTLTATIGMDGRVLSSSSSGTDAAVGKCMESQVKAWRFPAARGTTTVHIPFAFMAQ
jgi:hypothetical protein